MPVMSPKLIPASTAHSRACTSEKAESRALLELIALAIERAVNNGQLSTIVPGAHKPDVIQELKAAGYTVAHNYDPRNKDSWYSIKW